MRKHISKISSYFLGKHADTEMHSKDLITSKICQCALECEPKVSFISNIIS